MARIIRNAESGAGQTVGPVGEAQRTGGTIARDQMESLRNGEPGLYFISQTAQPSHDAGERPCF